MSTGSFALARGLFARGLALTYGVAFLSFGVQARGLVGSRGILPAGELLDAARAQLGPHAWLEIPSLFWLRADDAALVAVCAAGVALSVALFLGLVPRVAAAALWMLYLSLLPVGQIFLGYQWDALLVETGFLAIAFVPGGVRVPLARTTAPGPVSLLLVRWLLFRLFLLSGLVKLLSGDRSWWPDLTAMTFHFWTQPIPNPLSPFAHALPTWMNEGNTVATLAIELGLPWCVFGPRSLRLAAAAGFTGLMLLINATGNYGFFGLLACVLCIPLVDDAVWRRLPLLRRLPPAPAAPPAPRAVRAAAIAAGALVVAITTGAALQRLDVGVPAPLRALMRAARPLESFHAYGLFAVMTKDRPEIEIDGSSDGTTWLPYAFRYKPDRADQRPREAGVHMPRLDWQMWFAALGGCDEAPWFLAFVRRLLEAEPRALALLARDPFDGARPRWIRTTLYRYRFADAATRARTGAWWSREWLGAYCPTVELDGDQLRAAPDRGGAPGGG